MKTSHPENTPKLSVYGSVYTPRIAKKNMVFAGDGYEHNATSVPSLLIFLLSVKYMDGSFGYK
jgi:hypothetical protein